MCTHVPSVYGPQCLRASLASDTALCAVQAAAGQFPHMATGWEHGCSLPPIGTMCADEAAWPWETAVQVEVECAWLEYRAAPDAMYESIVLCKHVRESECSLHSSLFSLFRIIPVVDPVGATIVLCKPATGNSTPARLKDGPNWIQMLFVSVTDPVIYDLLCVRVCVCGGGGVGG